MSCHGLQKDLVLLTQRPRAPGKAENPSEFAAASGQPHDGAVDPAQLGRSILPQNILRGSSDDLLRMTSKECAKLRAQQARGLWIQRREGWRRGLLLRQALLRARLSNFVTHNVR